MPAPILTTLGKSQVKIEFVVTPQEAAPYLDQAAQDLQETKPIQGFRPGKAPYDEVKRVFGEMRVWETALERIVRARFVQSVLEDHLETLGSPSVSVEQLVPGQDIKFTTIVDVMPSVLSLCSYDEPLVTKTVREVQASEVDVVIDDLRKMRREEVVVDRAATVEDAAEIDLLIKKDGVVVEGGTALKYKVYLREQHYIPGFSEQLIGLKKGDTKTFSLPFPKDHYQKHLAGLDVDFDVTVHDVYEMRLPEVNEEFVKALGVESVEKLREVLLGNLKAEAEHKADEASEIELLEKLVKGSRFSELPDLLLNEEVRRMYHELQHAAEEQGMNMDTYLQQLKKTADDLKLDMVPQAMTRIHTGIFIKEVAKREDVSVADEEVNAEIDRILDGVKDKETKEKVSSPEYHDYVASQMKNRKALEILKTKAIKQE